MSEKTEEMMENMQKIGKAFTDYKDSLKTYFKDHEVEIRDWNFGVGKSEKEYIVEVHFKLAVKPKA